MSRKTYSGQLVIKRNLKTPSVEKSAEGYCFRGRELAQNILRRFFGTILGQIYMKNPSESISKGFYRDSYRIQTCNLLIRSQMLYSVELRSRGFILRLLRLRA